MSALNFAVSLRLDHPLDQPNPRRLPGCVREALTRLLNCVIKRSVWFTLSPYSLDI